MDEAKAVSHPPNDAVLATQAIAGSVLPDFLWGGRSELPPGALEMLDVAIDAEQLAKYREVCGFPADAGVPGTYPHVLGFKLSMAMMTARDFPLPVLGMIHIGNRIAVRSRLDPATPLKVRVEARDLRPHPKGAEVDVVTSVSADGKTVWEETSTYLAKGSKAAGRDAEPAARREWPELSADARSVPLAVPAGTGKRYAAVSSDNNPIHTFDLTAKLFGFPRAIAQGMWTLARCLAELADQLPEAYEAEVTFRKPVIMPASTLIRIDGGDGHWTVWLTDESGDHTHLILVVTAR